jgi:uncharacterized protein (TIGR02145 family)
MIPAKTSQGIITTADVSEIKQTTAVSGGVITSGKWGPVTSRGVCWAATTDPAMTDNKTIDGNQTGSFISKLTGLQPGTSYYLRAYATSPTDTIYGRNIEFITQAYTTVSDIEGNVYNVISIGKQVWMAENLRTNKYNDSTSVLLVKDEIQWAGLSSPAFCWYKNDEEAFKPTYGALYNWYAVNSGKLCPSGWHIPSDAEWTELTTFLGGDGISGVSLRNRQPTGLNQIQELQTNRFTAFPGGFRYYDGKFFDFGFSAYWWSSGEFSSTRAWFRFVYYNDANVYRFNNIKKNGFSVRCIKD